MKTTALTNLNNKIQQGFTLIELIVVIAILGVLATVLLVLIDPLDKINLANDTGVISTISQLGKANDAYAAQNTNLYVGCATACTFAGAVTALNTAGETKLSSVTAPANYTYSYFQPAACTAAAQTNCTTYVFSVNLRSKKYTSGNGAGNSSYFVAANGKSCVLTNQAAAPTAATVCP